MRLLIILSCNDFDNFTRRATVEAICEQHPNTTIIFFTGIKGYPVKKPSNPEIRFKIFYGFSLGKFRKWRRLELFIKSFYWKSFINGFDTIFLTDPNQDIFLGMINNNKKLAYLIRDPSVFLSKKNFETERKILQRDPHVFAISKGLCKEYLHNYYSDLKLSNITYWPNTADLVVWNYDKYNITPTNQKLIVGVSGNLTDWLDFDLLDYVVRNNPNYHFAIYGKNELTGKALKDFENLLKQENIRYYGYVPFKKIPEIVSQWKVGLVLGRKDTEYSIYWGNNKIYQFTALGKPFVAYYHNDEYEKFGEAAFLANNKEEYSEQIKRAVEKSFDKNFQRYCVQRAKENSNTIRAQQFISAITESTKKT